MEHILRLFSCGYAKQHHPPADALNCSKEKILRYAIAHAGLSICWSLEDGGALEQSENAQERLAFLTVARSLLSS